MTEFAFWAGITAPSCAVAVTSHVSFQVHGGPSQCNRSPINGFGNPLAIVVLLTHIQVEVVQDPDQPILGLNSCGD
jgi:hypothetical protein